MLNFNEYQYRELGERINLSLQAKENEILNPWEVMNDINIISSLFYKIELFQTISSLIANGIDESRIFIMNKEFALKDTLFNILQNDDYENFKRLHNYGNLIPLKPNKDYKCTSILFLFREESKKFTNFHDISGFSNEHFKEIIKKHLSKKMSYIEIVDILAKEVLIQISKIKSSNKKEKIIDHYTSIVSKYKQMLEDYYSFPKSKNDKDIQKFIDKNKRLPKHLEELFETHYNQFHECMINIDRPIVGILDDTLTLKFKILNKDSLIYTIENPNAFIELVAVGHHSPWYKEFLLPTTIIAVLALGPQFYSSYAQGTKDLIEADKMKYELCIEHYDKNLYSERIIKEKCYKHISKYIIEKDYRDD